MFAFRDVQRGFRDERWKLIRYPQIDRTQLFDLKNDPFEITNLAGQPAHAERVRGLTASLLAEMKRMDDPLASLTASKIQPAAFDPNNPPSAIGKAKAKGKGKAKG